MSEDETIVFHTESGSVYEVDEQKKRLRKIGKTTTDRLSNDGKWKNYHNLDLTDAGNLIIVWNITDEGIHQSTITSRIVKSPEPN